LALEGDKEALEIIDFAAQKLFESFDVYFFFELVFSEEGGWGGIDRGQAGGSGRGDSNFFFPLSLPYVSQILYAKAGFSGAVDVVLSGGNFEHVQGENSLAGKLQQKILAKYPEARTGLPNMSASFAAAKLIMKDAKQ
jgi:hypothetical protein